MESKEEYTRATSEYAELIEATKAVLTDRDAHLTVQRLFVAAKRQEEALEAYTKALRRFADFVLRRERH